MPAAAQSLFFFKHSMQDSACAIWIIQNGSIRYSDAVCIPADKALPFLRIGKVALLPFAGLFPLRIVDGTVFDADEAAFPGRNFQRQSAIALRGKTAEDFHWVATAVQMAQKRICPGIQLCNFVVVAVKIFELLVCLQMDFGQPVIIEIKLYQFCIPGDVNMPQTVFPRADPLAKRKFAGVQCFDLIILFSPEALLPREKQRPVRNSIVKAACFR